MKHIFRLYRILTPYNYRKAMKKLAFPISLIALSFVFSSCGEDEDKDNGQTVKLGQQAAVEFCDCYSEHSKDDCLDKMTSNYSASDYMSDNFIAAFNQQSSCGIQLEKKYTYSKSYPAAIGIAE